MNQFIFVLFGAYNSAVCVLIYHNGIKLTQLIGMSQIQFEFRAYYISNKATMCVTMMAEERFISCHGNDDV